MLTRTTLLYVWQIARQQQCGLKRAVFVLLVVAGLASVASFLQSCERRPELYLRKIVPTRMTITNIGLNLDTYWDYQLIYGIYYDWRAEWYYGWDEEDERIFGPMGYIEPTAYNLRRYYTGDIPYRAHTNVMTHTVNGDQFTANFELGYWDILVWNDIVTKDNVQSLNFDESSSLDSIIAYTNPSMRASRYQAPKYTNAFYQPEDLFSAYEQAIEINEDLDGFVFDEARNVWVKVLDMMLEPVTYIYLTQVILRHNNNKITGVDGTSDLSNVARATNINTGKAADDPVTVHYNVRFKKNCDKGGETVDIAGGRLMTFGIPGLTPRLYRTAADSLALQEELRNKGRHFMDVKMQFNNGNDTTFVFDVTDQVQRRFRGGVITVELDMDTIPVPHSRGGSAFDAVVEDYEEVTHEFDM